jgi:hypothetical protein
VDARFSWRGVTATMAPGRGRSSLSSALVVLTSDAAGDSDTPVGDVPASAGTRCRAVNQGGDQHGEGTLKENTGAALPC